MSSLKLSECADVFSGFAFKSADMCSGDGIPLIKIKNIANKKIEKICDQSIPYGLLKESHKKYFLKKDDILVAMTGQGSVGRIGRMMNAKDDNFLVNQRVGIIRPREDKIDPHYLFSVLAQESYGKILFSLGVGAGQPNISPKDIGDLAIPCIDIVKGKEIGGIRKVYDCLIENNNHRISILEEMAKLLYREWFVKFRYPGHENQKMVESPLGLIPEGWKVDKLINLTSKIGSGATPRGGDSAYKNEGIPLIRSLNIYDGKFINKNLAYIDDEQAAKLKNVTVQVGDVLLNITGASVARCAIVPASLTPARVNQHVSIIRTKSNELSAEYILYTLISENGKSRLLSIAQGGATREAITKSHIENFQLIIPDGELLKQFSRIALSITKQKEKLFFSIENLKEQRDMLLPKLISGQISLNMEGP